MPNPEIKLTFRSLFADVLSQKFVPAVDASKREHTLGRLAHASYRKGLGHPHVDEHMAFYRPMWADGVVASTVFFERRAPDLVLVTGLTLATDTEHVGFMDLAEEDISGVEVTADGQSQIYPLELGEKLNEAQAAVTQVAVTFFERVANH